MHAISLLLLVPPTERFIIPEPQKTTVEVSYQYELAQLSIDYNLRLLICEMFGQALVPIWVEHTYNIVH